jgi:catechol 2,3-dioxygenase-like lactoylglutathione lyase family enzyme
VAVVAADTTIPSRLDPGGTMHWSEFDRGGHFPAMNTRPARRRTPHLPTTPDQGGLVIDHVGLGVSDLNRSRAFFERALAPLGYRLLIERDGSLGFGRDGKPDLFVHVNRPVSGPTHVAVASPDRATVDAFHAAGLAAGGRDNGPPGLRPHYHRHYYGAFVLDPDGNNLEAVCHRPS